VLGPLDGLLTATVPALPAAVREPVALHYTPADYTLTITQQASVYEVMLTLRLLPTAPSDAVQVVATPVIYPASDLSPA
jgi:hypothetical protein